MGRWTSSTTFWPIVRFALGYGVFAAAWVLAGYLATGGANLARYGWKLHTVVAWYLGAALVVGVVVGWLGPKASSRLGGACLGFLASVPVSLSFNFTLSRAPLSGWKLVG